MYRSATRRSEHKDQLSAEKELNVRLCLEAGIALLHADDGYYRRGKFCSFRLFAVRF